MIWSFLLLAQLCEAKKPKQRDSGPTTTSMRSLETLLAEARWQPSPELSGVFRAGRVFWEREDGSHVLLTSSCFSSEPTPNSYTSVEVLSNLQAGVSVKLGAGKLQASGNLVKQMKFGAPIHETIEHFSLTPTTACVVNLQNMPLSRLQASYAIQEALVAEIAEQTCGTINAEGKFVGLGKANGELSRACSMQSLEPVVVGVRTVPLTELIPAWATSPPKQPTPAVGSMVPVKPLRPGPLPTPLEKTVQQPMPKPVMPAAVPMPSPTPVAKPPAINTTSNVWGTKLEYADGSTKRCSRAVSLAGYSVATLGTLGVLALNQSENNPLSALGASSYYIAPLGGLMVGGYGEAAHRKCVTKASSVSSKDER